MKLCLTITCFQWREKYYEQTYGAPMGSPLSPVMANLFMEEFEKNALATATLKPAFWFRYVDHTLSSWCHGLDHLPRFLDHINSLHPSIKFTYEVQKDDKTIPYLDGLFTIREDGSLGHKVYRKPTHIQTGICILIHSKTPCVKHLLTERKCELEKCSKIEWLSSAIHRQSYENATTSTTED